MRVLTSNGKLKCLHQLGVADCRSNSQSWVRVGGHPVLVGNDPAGRSFGTAGPPCSIPTLMCLGTLVPMAGHSSFVRIGGTPVCLDTIVGLNQPSGFGYFVQDPGQTLVQVSS